MGVGGGDVKIHADADVVSILHEEFPDDLHGACAVPVKVHIGYQSCVRISNTSRLRLGALYRIGAVVRLSHMNGHGFHLFQKECAHVFPAVLAGDVETQWKTVVLLFSRCLLHVGISLVKIGAGVGDQKVGAAGIGIDDLSHAVIVPGTGGNIQDGAKDSQKEYQGRHITDLFGKVFWGS